MLLTTALLFCVSCGRQQLPVAPDDSADKEITEIQMNSSEYPEYTNMEILYNKADLVVVFEKEDLDSYSIMLKMGAGSELPHTITNFKIKDVLKGDDSLENVTVKQLGGTFDKVKYMYQTTQCLSRMTLIIFCFSRFMMIHRQHYSILCKTCII